MDQKDAALSGCSILVVHENYLVGISLAAKLREAGAEVVGPRCDVEALLVELRTSAARPDVALLGVNYHGEPPQALAEELGRMRVPVVLGPGYFPAAGGAARFRFEPDAPAAVDGLLTTLARLSA